MLDAMLSEVDPIAATEKTLKIALIGGGIGGLTLGIGLARHGIDFHIYEAAAQFSEIGAGVGLAPNARIAMTLIDPQILDGYNKHATVNYDDDHRGYFFQFRMGMDGRSGTKTEGVKAGDLIAAPGGPGCGISMIHRARFLEELVALLPEGSASFGKRLEHLEQTDDCVRMHFSDGSIEEADVVVGCDGVKSKVRSSIFGAASQPRFSGKYAYRGLIPMETAVQLVGAEKARNSQAYVGYGGHVLTMPVERGRIMNIVAFHAKPDGVWEQGDRWVLPMARDDLDSDFAGWSDDVRNILGQMQQPDLWALFDLPPLPSYHKGRVAVMGDAAHATTPHQGSGAAMAIEDAYVLSSLLAKVRKPSQLEAAFNAYDSVRTHRANKVVATSRSCGDLYELMDPEVGDDLMKMDEVLVDQYNWIWKADIEGLMQRATQRLESRL